MKRLAALLTPRRLTLWSVVLLVLGWGVHAQTMSTHGLLDRIGRVKGSDYVQFYVMGSLVRDGRLDALYDAQAHIAEGRRRVDPTLGLFASHPNYPPQVALIFAPLAAMPYLMSLGAFLALSTLCYAFSVWLVWRECDALHGHGGVVALIAAASPLYLTVVRYGQASAFALLALSLAFVAFRRGRPLLAGMAIGCLAYKPQFGIVIAVVLLVRREWRIVAGAAIVVTIQTASGWYVAGTRVFAQYLAELWWLTRNPTAVERYPSEVHSIRGFVQLLAPYGPLLSICAALALITAIVIGIRCWSASTAPALRWAQLIVLTLLASAHLLTYDLLLLTVPLLVLADWTLEYPEHPLTPDIRALGALLYLAPFSAMLPARLVGVQVSVLAMGFLAWRLYQLSAESRAIVAPRWEFGSSQNSTTRGWRSSAA